MAVVSVDSDITRDEDFEDLSATHTSIGGGPGASQEPDITYQGAHAWSRKVSTSGSPGAGFLVTTLSTRDMTTAALKVAFVKTYLVNVEVLNSVGVRNYVGSGTSAYYSYLIKDDGSQGDNGEFAYPPRAGWLLTPIDPNVPAWRDFISGSPSLSAITQIGCTAGTTSTSKSENLVLDALDFGNGLFLVGGDSTNPDGIFEDFVLDDEGTSLNGRFGIAFTQEGIIFVQGKLVIGRTAGGTVTATVFNDNGRTLVFPGGLVDAGWNEIEIDLGNASTDVDFNNCAFIGRGRNNLIRYFDSESDVDGTNEEIDIVGHGFITGDLVTYSTQGGTAVSGLTNNTDYFVRRVTADSIALYAIGATVGRQNAFNDTSRVGLTAAGAGTGQSHSLRRKPDTRPDLTITSTTGVGFNATGCAFTAFRNFSLNSKAILTSCNLINCFNIDLNQGKLDECVIDQFILGIGEAAVTTPDLSDITDCVFNMNSDTGGHAIDINTTGTFNFLGNSFTGYSAANRQGFHTTNDVTGGTTDQITLTAHGYVTGEPIYYGDEGGTQNIGLTDGNQYFVRAVDANTIQVHVTKEDATNDSNKISLTPGGAETHYIYPGNAMIVNSSGGAVTINVGGNGDTPTIRNTVGSTTTVNNNKAITISQLQDNTEIRVFTAGTTTALAGTENATDGSPGNRSFTFSLAAGTNVDIRIINEFYVQIDVLGFTIPSVDTTLPQQQQFDRNYNDPP